MHIRLIIFSLIIGAVCMTVPSFLPAQSTSVQKFFEAYGDNDNFTIIDVKGSLLNMMADKKNPNAQRKVTGFQLLSAPKGSDGLRPSAVQGFARKIKQESFEDLMVIRDEDTRINFMMQERNGFVKELIMVINEPESFTIMSLRGNIPLEELEELGDDIEIDGLEYLKKKKN